MAKQKIKKVSSLKCTLKSVPSAAASAAVSWQATRWSSLSDGGGLPSRLCRAPPPTPLFHDKSRLSKKDRQPRASPARTHPIGQRLRIRAKPDSTYVMMTHPVPWCHRRSAYSRRASALWSRPHVGGERSALPDIRQPARSRRRPTPPAEGEPAATWLRGRRRRRRRYLFNYEAQTGRSRQIEGRRWWLGLCFWVNCSFKVKTTTQLQQVCGGEITVSQAEAPAVGFLPESLQENSHSAPAAVPLAVCRVSSNWNTNTRHTHPTVSSPLTSVVILNQTSSSPLTLVCARLCKHCSCYSIDSCLQSKRKRSLHMFFHTFIMCFSCYKLRRLFVLLFLFILGWTSTSGEGTAGEN